MKKFFITLVCIIMVVCFMPTVATAGSGNQYTGTNTYAAAVCEVKGSADKFVYVSCDILQNGNKLKGSQMDDETITITAIKYKESGSKDDYKPVLETWINNSSGVNSYFAISKIPVGSYDIQITFNFNGIFNNGTKKDNSDDEIINVAGLVAYTTLDIIPDIKSSEEPLVLTISDVTASYKEIGQKYLPIPFKVMCGENDVSSAVEIRWEKVNGFTMRDSDPYKESDGTYTFGHLYPFETQICGTVPITAWAVYGHHDYEKGYELIVDKQSDPVTFNVTMTDGNQMFAAQVGNVGYNTLEAAITAATPGQTVKLLGDVTLTETQNVEKNITIDLNGHKITGSGARVFNVKSGTLTLAGTGIISSNNENNNEDFSESSSVIRVGANNDVAENSTAGLVIGNGVTISTPYCYGVSVFGIKTTETVVVNGKINVTGGAPALSGNGTAVYGGTNITINPTAEITAANDAAIYHPQSGTLTINGGKIEGTTGIECKAGDTKVTVSGNPNITATGTLNHKANSNGTSTSGYAIAVVENAAYAGGATVTIENGTYTGAVKVVKDSNVEAGKKGAISITGGTFSSDVIDYMSDDCYEYAMRNGTYIVKARDADKPAFTTGNYWSDLNGKVYTELYSAPYIPSTPTDSLKAARTEAIKAVSDYVNAADYEEAQQAEIKTIVDNAKKDIEAAKTADEIKAIEAAAKAELDKLETAEEMALIRTIEGTQFTARSKATTLNGKKAIRVTWNKPADLDFDGYEIYRSTERYKGYGTEPFFTTTNQKYTNNKGLKVGKTYYYKVRGFKYVNDEKVYTEYSLKAWRTVK